MTEISKKIKLEDIFELQMGKTPSRANEKYWKNGEYKWVAISDFNEYEKYIKNTKEKITLSAVKETKIKKVPKNTLIMSFKLSIGKTAITSEDLYTNEAIMAFLPKKDFEIDNNYFYYLFQNLKWNEGINKAVKGLTLNKPLIASKKIHLPNYKIQKKISERLDIIKEILNLKREKYKKLDELAKSLFIHFFGDPILNEKGWKKEILNNISPVEQKKNINKTKVWLLNLDMIKSQTGEIIQYKYEDLKKIEKNSILGFDEENILYSKLRPYLNKVVIPKKEGYCTTELVPFKPKKEFLNRTFLAYLLRSETFVNYISNKTFGTKMPRISTKELINFKCILPPLELQNKFAERIKVVEKLKVELQKSIDETQKLFDSLMDKYFG